MNLKVHRNKPIHSVVMLYYLLVLFFGPEHKGSNFLRNVGKLLPDYTASYSTSNALHGHWFRTSSVTGQKQSKEKSPS
jgi:hypothetical protein